MAGDTDSTQRLGKAMAEARKPSAETDTVEEPSSDSVFTKLHRISEKAKQDRTLQFTSLAHLLTIEMLGEAYGRLRNTLADFIAPGDTLPAEIHNMFISNVPAYRVERKSPFTFSCKDAGRIVAPTLVLTGDRSPGGFRHTAEAMAHCVVRGELATIPRASHPMQVLNPQAFNEAVLKFVAQH